MTKYVGIDLGTTNSCIAYADGDKIRVLINAPDHRTIPSVVNYPRGGGMIVGEMAARNALLEPLNTIYASKRLLGRKIDDPIVKECMTMMPYKIMPSQQDDAWIKVHGELVSPQEVAAAILARLRAEAIQALGDEDIHAVITVPAYYNETQRQATRDAAEIANLKLLRLLAEPTAAAIAYGLDKTEKQRIAVYDLGGGTFDVSILEVFGNPAERDFQVLATGGDTFLGGETFDMRLAFKLADEFKSNHGIDLRADAVAMSRLRQSAEKAKREVSFRHETDINVQYIADTQEGPLHLKRRLTRSEFEEMTWEDIDRSIRITEEVVKSAGLKVDDVQHIILVGGQTRMPLIRKMLMSLFGRNISVTANPDEVVAQGAAMLAAILHDQRITGIEEFHDPQDRQIDADLMRDLMAMGVSEEELQAPRMSKEALQLIDEQLGIAPPRRGTGSTGG